ncbi:MAG: polysaccharide biosynthesis tyrosine autokinase [Gammaproteobacteria bacterium]|nr:polysaccharide biosynthesis tyrosine autokinase [Gammaproteobacteria bacterium]
MNDVQQTLPPGNQQPDFVDDDTIDISEYIGMLIENRVLIGSITAACFFLATLYAFVATPIYRTDALLQVEQDASPFQKMDELASMMGADATSAVTEIEIIKSRKVIGGVIDKLNLTIEITPRYFPLFGASSARAFKPKVDELAEPWLWFDSYAWGGEVLDIDRLSVPRTLVEEDLQFVVKDDKHYALYATDELLLEGEVGVPAENADTGVSMFVSRMRARAGISFKVRKYSRTLLIVELQKKVNVSEKGRKTGILSVSLEGKDRDQITTVVDEITRSYLRQNVERRSEESEKMLEFISSQLPSLKTDLGAAEQALNRHREDKGTVDLSFESQKLIDRVADIESAISKLNIEKAELSQKLTTSHPVIIGINEKLSKLDEQRRDIETSLSKLPETELESVKLKRDVTVANELYMLLLNKTQELRVAKAGTVGSVRVIDIALPGEEPVKPKKLLIMAVSLILGFIAGIMAAALRKALNKTVEDPNAIEKNLGYAIYAEIPQSQYQEVSDKALKRKKSRDRELLAHTNKEDPVTESLRSLRTSIQFALLEATNNVVLISGPAPEIGKSFVSCNFSYVMAEADKKILLIDADMRKGHLHEYFGLERSPGLSELVSGEASLDKVIHKGALHPNLDVISSGVYPPNPSELLMSPRFVDFLEKVKPNYDLIIFDTPPILAVTDASVLARNAGTCFMVLRSGQHHMREISLAFKRFEQNGVRMRGAIFNGVEIAARGYGKSYGYKYYSYQYRYK